MKTILLFPGQGYQNMEMLNEEVQEYLCRKGFQSKLNEVLNDNTKLFDTELAQPLVVATQLFKTKQVRGFAKDIDDIEYMGLSLGEITALIASGAIEEKAGLDFATKRGQESKKFSMNELQQGLETERSKRLFGVIRVPLTQGVISNIEEWNNQHLSHLEKVSITNYMPSVKNEEEQDITVTADEEILINHITLFGGTKGQKMGKMQCPFHSSSLAGLAKKQTEIFNEIVPDVDHTKLPKVFSTRTGEYYSLNNSKDDISEALARYLLEPMQTTKTLQHLQEQKAQVIVMMGENFAKTLRNQYQSLGGNPSQIIYVNDFLREKQDKEKISKEPTMND